MENLLAVENAHAVLTDVLVTVKYKNEVTEIFQKKTAKSGYMSGFGCFVND